MSRDAILARISKALATSAPDGRAADIAQRLADPPRNLVPRRADKEHSELVRQFVGHLQAQSATVFQLEAAQIPSAIAGFLRAAGLAPRLRCGSDPFLAAVDWASEPVLEMSNGAALPHDAIGLSVALAGVSETGTLFLASGPENPVTLAFLPETHIIILAERTIVGSYEDGFLLVRSRFGAGTMPRTLNLVSGPSRTADIGGRIVIGAHGPRRICVIVVKYD